MEKDGLTHDELVAGIKAHVRQVQATEALLALPLRSPEEIIHYKLYSQCQSSEFDDTQLEARRKDFFFNLALGWDALSFERFGLLSTAASVSAYALNGYARETESKSVALTPYQLKALMACAEVAGIPFKPAGNEVPIPEAALHYNELLLEEAKRTHTKPHR